MCVSEINKLMTQNESSERNYYYNIVETLGHADGNKQANKYAEDE